MMKIVRIVIDDIRRGRNLDIYLTVVIAGVISTLGTFSIVKQEVISSAILATLALVAISVLQNRNEGVDIKYTLAKLQDDYSSAESFLHKYNVNQLRDLIPTAQSAFFWGVNYRRTITLWDFGLEQALKNGATLRFLLAKPNSSTLEMAAFMRKLNATKDKESLELQNSITQLAGIGFAANAIDRIQIKVIDYLPPWSITTINPQSPSGRMSVILYTFRTSSEERPTFQLVAEKDRNWFNFFLEQFETVWNEAEAIELSQYLNRRHGS